MRIATLTGRLGYRIAGVAVALLLLLSSCDEGAMECDHCHKQAETSDKLIDGIDMQVCEDCYESYLRGEWGMN